MSYRDRSDQRDDWDGEGAGRPPIWADDRSSRSTNRAGSPEPESFGDLPAWSPDRRDRAAAPGFDAAPERPVARPGRASSRAPERTIEWPNLRDSLRGSTLGASPETRAGRRASTTLRQPAVVEPDPYEEPVYEDAVDDESYAPMTPVAPTRRRAAATRHSTRRARTARPRPPVQVPAALTSLMTGQDRALATSIGLSAFSLLLMAATTSSRSGDLPSWIALHLDAAGRPDHWGTTSTIWRIPLMALMLTVSSLLAALFIGRRDLFAARFVAASSLLIQALSWIALIRLLW